MYIIEKELEVSGGHCLRLPYESKCRNKHGHNWLIKVQIKGECLQEESKMLLDFVHIKEVVMQLDHDDLNSFFGDDFNPTAENIANWIAYQINLRIIEEWKNENPSKKRPFVSKVEIEESKGNKACYLPTE